MLWQNRHIERSFCEVEISIRITKDYIVTIAIDLSATFISLRDVNFVQDDVVRSTQIRVEPFLQNVPNQKHKRNYYT